MTYTPPFEDWSPQTDQPDTDFVGLLASNPDARRSASGLLLSLAVSYPDRNAAGSVDAETSENWDLQARLAWLGHQIVGLQPFELLGEANEGTEYALTIARSGATYTITLEYPPSAPGAAQQNEAYIETRTGEQAGSVDLSQYDQLRIVGRIHNPSAITYLALWCGGGNDYIVDVMWYLNSDLASSRVTQGNGFYIGTIKDNGYIDVDLTLSKNSDGYLSFGGRTVALNSDGTLYYTAFYTGRWQGVPEPHAFFQFTSLGAIGNESKIVLFGRTLGL